MIPRGFEKYSQFILWRAVDLPDGRTNKIPIDHRTGAPGDAHDAGAWLDGPTAVALADALGLGVGFVFTAADPFFFLDIDHAWEADGWSDLAVGLVARLDGCAVEVSQSGEGLHVFGTSAPMLHKCKNVPLGLELYTERRFVALTGREARGDARLDVTDRLATVIEDHFQPDATADGRPFDWTTESATGWNGPADNLELIDRAKRAKPSAAATFGKVATFGQLFAADVDALARAYPDENGRDYDASSADMALAQHLAFWTGKNCQRMRDIMELSELKRSKWEDRAGYYLERTVTVACTRQENVYSSTPPPRPPRPGNARTGPAVLCPDQQIDHFEGCVYVSDEHRVRIPNGERLKPEAFRARMGGRCFLLDHPRDEGKTPTTKDAFKAFTENEALECDSVASVRFRPDRPPVEVFEDESRRYWNSYQPRGGRRLEGDPGPFLEHVRRMIPDDGDREILLSYMAACVQLPAIKAQWAPVVIGAPGNGKTRVLRDSLEYALGPKHCHDVNPDDLGNKFNAWVEGKLLATVEEVRVGGRTDVANSLKPLITNRRLPIQAKGVDQRVGDNFANFLLFSNHRDAIYKDNDDRRYAVFYTAQETAKDIERDGMSSEYFDALFDWFDADGLAIVADYLATRAVSVKIRGRAPLTTGEDEAVRQSFGAAEQLILEAVQSHEIGFRDDLIWSLSAERLLKENRKPAHPNLMARVMRNIGYVKHPALAGDNGRIEIDGVRRTVYAKLGTIPELNHTSAAGVKAAMERALDPAVAY